MGCPKSLWNRFLERRGKRKGSSKKAQWESLKKKLREGRRIYQERGNNAFRSSKPLTQYQRKNMGKKGLFGRLTCLIRAGEGGREERGEKRFQNNSKQEGVLLGEGGGGIH